MPQAESRRVFLLGAAAAAGGLLAATRRAAAAEPGEAVPLFAYIGCFTSERRKAHAKGISVYRIDANGSWSLVQTLETLPNPQFITFDHRQKFLYSVHGDGTEVSSYAIDKASGRISFLNKQPTSGNNSTHLTPDPTNRYIVIGNGIGVAVFPINSDGSLAPYSDMVPAGGDVGPHRNQVGPGPHPHFVGFDPSGRFLLAPDRGTDRTHIYRLDLASGELLPNNPAFAGSRPGAGPRHLAFHPAKPWAYVCDELDSTVTAYAWDSARGELKPFQVITTLPGGRAERAPDLLEREFVAKAPNRCWVADFTHVKTWAGVVYVAFVVDTFSRRIVGWSAATVKETVFVLDALQMAVWQRDRDQHPVQPGELIHHSDAGSQYTSFRLAEHLDAAGIAASIGSVGDAYDNALMESTIGLYKTELIKPRRPWKSLSQVELATAEWVDWYNHRRLHGEIGHVPPVEYEANHYMESTKPQVTTII